MKLCIYGAGAVGGHLAARFAAQFPPGSQHELSLICRGPQLEAIKRNGVTLYRGDEVYTGRPSVATDNPDSLPPQQIH